MHDGAQEAELLRKAGRGDEAAFLVLYERHRTPVFRFTCRMLGTVGLAEDVINAVAFLSSDRASFITGQLLPVSGGYQCI